MAKPNYQYKKYQKELAKKKKAEEKRQRKLAKKESDSRDDAEASPDESETA